MGKVFSSLKATSIFLIAVVLLQLAACGGSSGGNPDLDCDYVTDSPPITVREQSLSDAIDEIHTSAHPSQVEAELWEKLTSELVSQLSLHRGDKLVSVAPSGDQNIVSDLAMQDDGAGGFTLEWTYLNAGDYDRNSEVNLADITPIALNYGATSAAANWDSAQLADGDGNGEVNLADISTIAINYMSQVYAYEVQGSYFSTGPWETIEQLTYTTPPSTDTQAFSYSLGSTDYSTYSVVPIDSAGVEGVHSVLIAAAPSRLTSPLTISEDSGFTGMDIETAFTIGLGESIGVPISAELVEVDGYGNELAVLGDLWDDGDPLHGDEYADDSNLGALHIINRAVAGEYFFRADITFDDGGVTTIASNTVALTLLEEIADERIDEILNQLDVFKEELDVLRDSMDPGIADAQMAAQLMDDPSVSEAGVANNNEGIWYSTSDGIGCSIGYPDPAIYGDTDETSAASQLNPMEVYTAVTEEIRQQKQVSSLHLNMPKSRRVLILDPFAFDFLPHEGGKELKEMLTTSGDPDCTSISQVDYFKDDQCTWEKFADMSDYGIIIIICHGKVYNMNVSSAPWYRQVLCTGTEIRPNTNLPVEQKFRLQDHLFDFTRVELRNKQTKTYLGFDQRTLALTQRLPNSIVFLAVCHSAEYPNLAKAFHDLGAGTFYGFDKSVFYPFAIDVCKDLFTGLRAGKDTSNVFASNPQLGVDPYNKTSYQEQNAKFNNVKLVKVHNPPNQAQALGVKPFIKIFIDLSKGLRPVLYDINNNGLVVGTLTVPDGPNQVAVWQINADNTTTCELVGPAMTANIAPTAINDSGLIVGNYPGPHGFRCEASDYGNIIELDDEHNHGANTASDVNSSGRVTGNTRFGPEEDRGIFKAMSWSSGIFTDLGEKIAFPGWSDPHEYLGVSINQASVIVGSFKSNGFSGSTREDAFIYRDGQMDLLERPFWATGSITTDINDAGWVVGKVIENDVDHGYIWNTANPTRDAKLPIDEITYGFCEPRSINNEHQIVGSAFHKANRRHHAAYWEQIVINPDAYAKYFDYYMYDLNCLLDGSYVTTMVLAKKINDKGQIIGETMTGEAFIIAPKNVGD